MRTLLTTAALLLAVSGPAAADVEATIQSCADCHGEAGASTESDVPSIGGISALVLTDAMAAYREEARPCAESKYRAGDTSRAPITMCAIAKEIDPSEDEAIAEYFAEQPFKRQQQPFDAALAAEGEKIHARECEKCHADAGSSPEDDAGILAGQWTPYLRTQMEDYFAGRRPMPEKMKAKLDKLDTSVIEPLLHYYAAQQ